MPVIGLHFGNSDFLYIIAEKNIKYSCLRINNRRTPIQIITPSHSKITGHTYKKR